VHIETGDLGVSLAHDRGLGSLAGTSQAQYATASARTRRDQPLPGGIGQMVESQLLVFVFCGKHQQKFSATRQYLLLAKRSIRHSKSARDAVDLLGGTRPDRPRMYLAADTHWTGDGARFAAGLLAARVREMLGPSPLQPKHSYRRETVTVPRRPDIPRMSRLRGEATAFPISWRFVCPRQ
jgi:hypothetical protein